MLGGPLLLYFLVLAGAFFFAADSIGTAEIAVFSALGLIGVVVMIVSKRQLDRAVAARSYPSPIDRGPRLDKRASMPLSTATTPPADQPTHDVAERERIYEYLIDNHIPFERHPHQPATSAQQLAKAVHVSGWRVAKTVLVRADGVVWMVVLPAAERIDWYRLRSALEADTVELLSEAELARLFPSCDIGAEPPFGRLFDLPTIVDMSMYDAGSIVCHAGSHEESLEIPFSAYARLERPAIGQFADVTG